MKVKEAIKYLNSCLGPGKDHITALDLLKLYGREVISRQELRTNKDGTSSMSTLHGVIKEMDNWFPKVCNGIGVSNEAAQVLLKDGKEKMLEAAQGAIVKRIKRR